VTQESSCAQWRAANVARWNACVAHRLVHELFAGTLDAAVLRQAFPDDAVRHAPCASARGDGGSQATGMPWASVPPR